MSDGHGGTARRVVVTGLGPVSSIGTGVTDFLDGLRAGRSGARPMELFDTKGFEYSNGCEVADFDPTRWQREVATEDVGRATQFALAAARLATADAGLSAEDLAGARTLIAVGTTDGEAHELDRIVEHEVGRPVADSPETMARRVPVGTLSAAVAQEFNLAQAETITIATACAAGNYAIGYGLDAIRLGEADIALCGGADAVCRKTFAGFYRLGTIAPEVCQPFDADRKGILTGEGGGILVLEALDSALARGARIHAEVLGYGLNCDAHHPVAPFQDRIADCVRLALADAGVKPGDVDLISAHGTGTAANDVTESSAIRDVYGKEMPRTVSMKSMLGHSMGAASALGAIGCALAIEHGFIPPTINHRTTDPECAVDCVPNHSVTADLRVVQNNGLAFGGNNSVVILGRYES